ATFSIYADADVVNKDANYDEKFWEEVYKDASEGRAIVTAQTKKTLFHVTTGIHYVIETGGTKAVFDRINVEKREKYAGNVVQLSVEEGTETVIYKYAAILSSENHAKEQLPDDCRKVLDEALSKGFEKLFAEHAKVW